MIFHFSKKLKRELQKPPSHKVCRYLESLAYGLLDKSGKKTQKLTYPYPIVFVYYYKIVYIINNKLVITKGYGVRATMIECQMRKFRLTDMIVKTRVIRLRVID